MDTKACISVKIEKPADGHLTAQKTPLSSANELGLLYLSSLTMKHPHILLVMADPDCFKARVMLLTLQAVPPEQILNKRTQQVQK